MTCIIARHVHLWPGSRPEGKHQQRHDTPTARRRSSCQRAFPTRNSRTSRHIRPKFDGIVWASVAPDLLYVILRSLRTSYHATSPNPLDLILCILPPPAILSNPKLQFAGKFVVAPYHILAEDMEYSELGDHGFDRLRPDHLRRHYLKRLEKLSLEVDLQTHEPALSSRPLAMPAGPVTTWVPRTDGGSRSVLVWAAS